MDTLDFTSGSLLKTEYKLLVEIVRTAGQELKLFSADDFGVGDADD